MSTRKTAERWRGEPLPRGRHGLSAETVRRSQRERIVRAMLDRVASRGYAATTVPDVIAAARVSRNAFYELFDDKEDCFLAACEEEAADLLEAVNAFPSEPDWVEAVRLGYRAYLRWWQERPEFTRAYFLEMPAVGRRAVEQRNSAYEPYQAMFARLGERARSQAPDLPSLREATPRLLVIAVTEFIASEVRAGRGGRLVELEDDLVFLTVKLLADDETARRAVGEARPAPVAVSREARRPGRSRT